MDLKRAWRIFRLYTIFNGTKRMDYIRKHHIFASFGEKSTMSSKVIPLYPELISIGNNVRIAAKVSLVPHDMIHAMLNNSGLNKKYNEYMGCIKIDDNVFIGANTTILADVYIGKNVIVGAGSLVNKDLEGGYVYAGVPAKRICSFNDFIEKREKQVYYPERFERMGDSIDSEFAKWFWSDFRSKHVQSLEE